MESTQTCLLLAKTAFANQRFTDQETSISTNPMQWLVTGKHVLLSSIRLLIQACVSLVEWNSLRSNNKHNNNKWLSIDIFELLSYQACVSLFDNDSLENNSNIIYNRCSIKSINHLFPTCIFNQLIENRKNSCRIK